MLRVDKKITGLVKEFPALGAMEGAGTMPSRRMAAFNPFLSANDPKGRMVIFDELGTVFALSLSLSLSLL
jgi:hypothetical protein